MLLPLSWLLGLLGCLILVPSAYSIEVGLSAEDGGSSIGLYNDYEASDGISINENANACFGDLEITDSREVAGSGDLNLYQEFLGSNGLSNYIAGRELLAASAHNLLDSSNAILKPTSFDTNACTTANAETGLIATGINGNTGPCFAEFLTYLSKGLFQNRDSMNIDNGMTGTHSSIFSTTGQGGNLYDLGIASNGGRPDSYMLRAHWDDPVPYVVGIDASVSVQKTSLDFRAIPIIYRDA